MAYTVVELLLLLLRFFALSSFPLGSAAGGGPLRFRSVVGNDASSPPQQQFKIVQFSDLHLDSTGDQCANASACITLTQGVMRTVLAAEAPVDLVVMAGDIACFTRACYDASVAPMREAGLPWAFINGNHDTASSGRGWQLHYDMTLATHGSRTQSLNNATSTYMLSVLPKQAAAEMAEVAPPAVNLWFFDSGDVECEGRNVNNNGCVDGAQLAWLRSHAQPRAAFGLAWVHIPLPEVMAVWSNTNSTGHCHDTVCCSAINPGLYSELLKRGDIHGVFSGHDHYNDYFGDPTGAGLLVGYGRKTGMSGGTGPLGEMGGRGGRVFSLVLDSLANGTQRVTMETWVRRQDGKAPSEPKNRVPDYTRGAAPRQWCCDGVVGCPW